MQVMNVNSNQPSFGQVNVIRVAKSAFQNPEQNQVCEKIFNKKIAQTVNDMPNFLSNFLVLFGIGGKKIHKTAVALESPGFQYVENIMGKNNIPSRAWLSMHTETPVTEAADKNYHTFYVLTGEHKDEAIKIMSSKYLFKILKSVMKEMNNLQEKVKNDPRTRDGLFLHAKAANMWDKDFKTIINDEKVHEFTINNLDELKTISEQLGVK